MSDLFQSHGQPDSFPVDLLPPVVRQYVVEGAESRAAAPSIVALPVLVTLGACVGTTHKIAAKQDWIVPAMLWGAVVARSGSVKSVGYDLAHELLKHAEDQANREFENAKREYDLAEQEYRKAHAQWLKSKEEIAPPVPPEPPTGDRLVVDDQTVESLAPLLVENPKGLFLLSDELRGFFDGMGAYASGGRAGKDEARWLTLFDGRPLSVDRKTNRERIYAPMAGVSVAGTIQPGTLAKAVSGGQVESGLLARLLLVMPEPRPKRWTDAEMHDATKLAMQRLVDRLRSLEHKALNGSLESNVLRLDNEARDRFKFFVNAHGLETFKQHDSLAAAYSKLEGYALRFALIHHLAVWASGDQLSPPRSIGLESIEAGIELSRWFAAEAERVYEKIGVVAEPVLQPADQHLDRLEEWLRSKGGAATERDISRGPRRYRSGHHVEDDCKALIQAGRAKWDVSRRTRHIVLAGDSDSSAENETIRVEVSPSQTDNTEGLSTTANDDGRDTISLSERNKRKVSPSPPNTASFQERIRVTI
ncbi:DUF3987 domain-containing protein [Rhodopirellula europaea]|uniref:Uncharacterized protein n=1 Tax=Rhodopirellula europaea 6C TaxID=1263867 RepID=M2ATN2_9BACT|nr:DUF3987 domain-containing protein [Rhodopirellula europaea]EMB16047.1 hypothetical protein RE6C_03213 [Rhodopirellula europaea 6C]